MQTDLLCKMVATLIQDRDEVGLPGLGAFYAEVMPASFSDKGFTINPPYRRLSFRSGQSDDTSLVECYCAANGVAQDEAEGIISSFLKGLAEELREQKSVELPGLGKLKATKDNIFFFVGDPDLNIFPDGFGLEPISLRAHDGQIPVARPIDAEPAEEPVEEPAEGASTEAVSEPATAPAEPENSPVEVESTPAEPEIQVDITTEDAPAKKHRKFNFWRLLLWLVVCAAVALALFAAIARLYPDIVDTILYTPEELRILNS